LFLFLNEVESYSSALNERCFD